MTETAASSIDKHADLPTISTASGDEYVEGRRATMLLITLFLVSAMSQIDRILPFVLAESIKEDLDLMIGSGLLGPAPRSVL
ncbi:hypothetical protein [Rhizobium etli]|uniref:hypothetical protein n=1 Tax=Rhizobium etli TaxID=29449 RepID=UPI00093D8025|nr:hypothetical protein [Rhizobium etli]